MPGKKLLVADDSLTIQKVIKLALSNEGYVIQAVSDGKHALEQLAVFRPDVVLIDVTLPSQSAFEIKRAVNSMEDLKQTRFVLMSSAFEKVDETQAEEVHFHGRLTKPFDPAHLRNVLLEVLTQADPQSAGEASIPPFQLLPPAPPTDFPLPPLDLNPMSLIPPGEDLSDWDLPLEPMSPMPLPPSEANDSGMGDIKHLTESTIRMSGLDDFEWSVQEPTLKPLPSFLDDGDSNFHVEPPKSYPEPPSITPSVALSAPIATHAPQVSLPQIPSEQLSQEISATIKKELSRLLPEIAERVIKEEIHKLLSERF